MIVLQTPVITLKSALYVTALATFLKFGVLTTSTAAAADLLSVFQQAIESDATLAGQRFRYRADQQRIVQARSGLRPQVGFNGRYGLNRDEFHNTEGVELTESYASNNISLGVSQTLFDRAARRTVEKSKGEVQLSALELNDTRQNVALRVAIAYFDVLAAQDNLEVARSEMSAISRQLDLAREMLDVGLGTKTDLFDTEARFKLAEVSEIEALNSIEDALRSLQAITGSAPNELAPLSDDAPVAAAEPAQVEYWVSLGLARSLNVLVGDQAAEVARLQTEINRFQRSPTVDLVYNDGRRDREGPSNDNTARDLSLQFNVPIYQGGAISSRSEEAHLRHQAALEDSKQARRETERLIRNAYLDVDSNVKRIAALLQAVSASESAVQARQEGFAAGISTNLDVLDAQRDLFGARRDYLRARYDHIINLLTLERAAGTLEDENIARINGWLASSNSAALDNGRLDRLATLPQDNDAKLNVVVNESVSALGVGEILIENTNDSLVNSTVAVATTEPSPVTTAEERTEPVVADQPQALPADPTQAAGSTRVLYEINHQSLGAGSLRLDFNTRGPIVGSYSFDYLDPLRLAIDLYDVQLDEALMLLELDNPLLALVEARQQDGHTQVVLNLKQAVNYDNTTHNGGVVVVLRAVQPNTLAHENTTKVQ